MQEDLQSLQKKLKMPPFLDIPDFDSPFDVKKMHLR